MTSKLTSIGELVTVVVRSPNRYISSSKMARKGLRSGNTRIVSRTDRSAKGGYQFLGDFIQPGENEVPVGGVILEQYPERHWAAWIVLPDGSISEIASAPGSDAIVTLRKEIEHCLADPAACFRTMRDLRLQELREIEAQTNAKADDIKNSRKRLARIERMVEFIDAGGIERVALCAERETLVARLSKIDALLAQ